jgi:hypothetical protein
MKPAKFSNEKISFDYRGASVSATGTLAKLIAYSFAAMLILLGIATVQRASNNLNNQFLQNQKNLL